MKKRDKTNISKLVLLGCVLQFFAFYNFSINAVHSAQQRQKTVLTYLTSEQLLSVGFER